VDEQQLTARIERFFSAENEYYRSDPATGDIRPMLQELDPDVVVELAASLPHGGTWRGRTGFTDLVAAVGRQWAVFEVVSDGQRWHRIDDGRVLVEGVLRGVLRATGTQVRMPFVSLFSFTDRGLSRLVHYYQDTAAVVAAAR
jgi:ketosteroid isomerase-like protein